MAIINGTAGNDYLVGTAVGDQIHGLAGNDTLVGGAGNDTLDGGVGIDTASYVDAAKAVTVSLALEGVKQQTIGDGADTLISIENLIGSNFNDTLTAGAAAAGISGGGGDDLILSGAGDDTLNGGTGTNTVSYVNAHAGVTVSLALQGVAQNTVGAGHDVLSNFLYLTGSAFNDVLTGDVHNNSINGGAGNDVLSGGAGNDFLYGSDGNDTLDGGAGNDTVNGGAGNNTASYADAAGGVTVSLALLNTAQNTGAAGTDTLASIQNLIGSNYGDHFYGSTVANLLMGGSGDDTLESSAGDDTMNGGTGSDTVSYGSATTPITVSLAVAGVQSIGGSMKETLVSIENIIGSNYNDTLTGGGPTGNVIYGGAGNDTINGGANSDVLYGGLGNDLVYGGGGNDTLYGGAGVDALFGGAGADHFVFTSISESPPDTPDGVLDFQQGVDKLDLSAIDANVNQAGQQHFTLVSSFTHVAGQLVISHHSSVWEIDGDVNGDGASDFSVNGIGAGPAAGDLIL
jgi:Ca2+-binding RTX toxin-like protein